MCLPIPPQGLCLFLRKKNYLNIPCSGAVMHLPSEGVCPALRTKETTKGAAVFGTNHYVGGRFVCPYKGPVVYVMDGH